RGEHGLQLRTEAGGEIHVLVAQQHPVFAAMLERARKRICRARRMPARDDARIDLLQPRRMLDVQPQLALARGRYDDGESRAAGVDGARVEAALRMNDELLGG